MKNLVFCLILIPVFCLTNALGQKTNLVGTTWKMSTCICDGTDNDWDEEGTITFLKNGRIEGSNGRWKVVGNKLVVTKLEDYTHGITAKIKGNRMTGEIEMGMSPRLFKFKAIKL